ncbi:MAG: 5'-deoxyadenosine deaminase [Acidobacteriota bacterium]
MANDILITGGQLITIDPQQRIIAADLLISRGRIAMIAPSIRPNLSMEVIDARGRYVLPGFVQTHIHLCQTLFRGAADDLSLIDWLRKRIWPLEGALSPETLSLAARLGIAELIKGGTTTALSMESVNHTDAVFTEIENTGFRATTGKCMMDQGDAVPTPLLEETGESIEESLRLLRRWHGAADGRINYCFAPRFAVSCTPELLAQTATLARELGVLIHTHASESLEEVELVMRQTGLRNIEYLQLKGLTGNDVVLAHCIHLTPEEIDILRLTGTSVAHCPSSNLKLGSGIAPIVELLAAGIEVTLGADGAPCNNRLDMFTEMRTAALLQKVKHGPESLPAWRVLEMATIGGARTLQLADQIGTIEIGKKADLQIIDLNSLHTTPHPDPVSTIVYAAQTTNVETVLIDGRVVMRDRQLQTINEQGLIQAIKQL